MHRYRAHADNPSLGLQAFFYGKFGSVFRPHSPALFLACLGKRPGPDQLGKIASFYKELEILKRKNVICFLNIGTSVLGETFCEIMSKKLN